MPDRFKPTYHAATAAQPRWQHALWTYGPLAVCLGVVFALSCTRVKIDMLPYAGVTRHVLAFAVIALLFWRVAEVSRFAWVQRWACVLAVAGSSLFGAADEYHQAFVRGRDADPMDWLVDTLAAAGAMLIVYGVRRWMQRRNDDSSERVVVVDFVRPADRVRLPEPVRHASRPASPARPSTWPSRAACRSDRESTAAPARP